MDDIKDPEQRAAYLQSLDWHALESQFGAQTTRLVVKGAYSRVLTLELGPMTSPLALDKCLEELTTHWNIDVEAHKSLMRRARPIICRGSAA